MQNKIKITTAQFKALVKSGAITITPLAPKKYRVKPLHEKIVESMETCVGVALTKHTIKSHAMAFRTALRKVTNIRKTAARWVIKNWYMFIFWVKENGRIPSIQTQTQKVYQFA